MCSVQAMDSSNAVTYLKHPLTDHDSSSSSSVTTKYDIFLSFYGKDTRNKFTAHLYAALVRHQIPTFIDDRELPTGDVIDDALKQAIKASKIYIVVFSENYAYSPWCLNELVEIYKCYETMQRMVICVYCNIDPFVVRHQKNSFAEAFVKHEKGHYKDKMELVNQWRATLTNVAGISGKTIPHERSEAAIIDEIIDVVLLKVNPKTLHVAKYPVGLDSAFETIMPILSSDRQGVIKFGIHGMGGVGKTTLAKALYNHLLLANFKDSSFLADVSENSGSMKGLASLQEQLVNDILKSKQLVMVPNVDQGIKTIEARICLTKILVVVDDLDNKKHFDSLVRSFASGSVVIITTRDEQILDSIKVKPEYRYRVNELDYAQSRAMFTQYAFEDTNVNKTLMKLFYEDIQRLAGGLPLALEVFGSYLSTQQSELGWRSYIEQLHRDPNNTIQQKLVISFNAIELDDPMLKKLYVDIACFFIGKPKEWTVRILGSYYIYADHKIDILKKRSLLTINSRNELRMHDLLRDMGREVARNNYPRDEPENHSRLWEAEDISKVLRSQMGSKAIECIIPYDLKHETKEVTSLSFSMETFTRMRRLRFLQLQGGTVRKHFSMTAEDLRWLHWDHCPLTYLTSEFDPKNIVILELPHSKIKKWRSKVVFKKLKTIDMSHSLDLASIPNINMFPFLETLYLRGCSSLKVLPEDLGNTEFLTKLHVEAIDVSKLPDSIGRLQKLVELDVSHNVKLTSLPDTICDLKALEFLRIDQCTSLKVFPIRLGKIESLKMLRAEGICVTELPDSIGSLHKLVELYLSHNVKLTSLPDTICNLRALEVLSVDKCASLKAFPTQLGKIESLKVLRAESLCVTKLPDSIGSLQKLVELYLSNNKELAKLPKTICNLKALEVLHIDECRSLKALPVKLGNIESLKVLRAEFLNIKKLPKSVGRLSRLVEVSLCSNINLTTLPGAFYNLRSLENLDISQCTNLKISLKQVLRIRHLKMLGANGTMLKPALPSNKLNSGLTFLPWYVNDQLIEPELPPNLISKSMEKFPYLFILKLLLGDWYTSLLSDTLTRRFFLVCLIIVLVIIVLYDVSSSNSTALQVL